MYGLMCAKVAEIHTKRKQEDLEWVVLLGIIHPYFP